MRMVTKPNHIQHGLPELGAHQAVDDEVDGGVQDGQVASNKV